VQIGKGRGFGWQGASLVTITYVHFLIFAQFAFLKRLTTLGIADEHLKPIMAVMAFGGIALSLLAPRFAFLPFAKTRLRIGLATSAVAAFLTLLPLTFALAIAVSFLIGAGLGLLTVTLVTHLRAFVGDHHPLLAVGAGTGIGYLVCNLPAFFLASPETQSLTAALLCILGIGVTFAPAPPITEPRTSSSKSSVALLVILCGFTALVWLDSAAFFIIQNTSQLKAGTWQGTLHLWMNGILHLSAALVSAWLLSRKALAPVLTLAFVALGTACLLLRNPDQILLASAFYPIGVSLYSVALVAYPALLAPAANEYERGKIAGWLYAVAGWTGSAMGIGMGQHLGQIPIAFVAAACAAVLLPQAHKILLTRKREISLAALVLLAAFLFDRLTLPVSGSAMTPVEHGRVVYISEGCIHCHSQYVRPDSSDVPMWGPATSISDVRHQGPPLIGNRRQGPDLSQVGARRSAAWIKAHFFNPAEVSGTSIMPSYGFLFRDSRGDDLVAYLVSLHTGDNEHQRALEALWQPSADSVSHANAAEGEQLYRRDCANCHDVNVATRSRWQGDFKKPPSSLIDGPLTHLSPADTPQQRFIDLAQITKFGIAGTDMPGHEYLSDRDIASLSLWIQQRTSLSNPNR
jgi:cbb3-type cytochrome oxidase cytochrome c subunit